MGRLVDISEQIERRLTQEQKVTNLSVLESLEINKRISKEMQKVRRISDRKQYSSRASSAKILLTY